VDGGPAGDAAGGADRPLEAPDDQILHQELAALCEAFLASLDEAERRLFTVRFLQGQSVEDCARVLAVSEHRVKSGERQLKKRFFLRMRACGYFEGYRLDKAGIAKVARVLLLFALARGR
jgi:DNA-directed RNA polymerase specialized sigma24 family protein